MNVFKVGDICVCKKHPECFFEPGSIVVITGKRSTVYLAKLMFGAIREVLRNDLAANTDEDGSVQCFPSELEPFNEQPSHMEKES